jgi:glycosyltransferase involved in cell wall biosynthesis
LGTSPQNTPPPGAPGISAFFPAYGDWGTIASLVLLVSSVMRELTDDWEVIVVNDASPDHTGQILAELQQVCPRLRVVTHEKNRGYGGALRSGFAAATKEWVFYTDGDAQYDVRELRQLWAAHHWMVKLAFGLKIRDVDCDFRLVRRAVFEKVELTRDSGLICVELVTKVEKNGFRVAPVPVHHFHRMHGKSQFFNVARVGRVATGMFGLWWELIVKKKVTRGG